MALATFRDIVIDCANPVELAKFWTRVLGYPVIRQDEDEACLDAGDGSFRIWLVRVPEPKTVKNRAHIDVNLQPGASIEQLVELGAEVLHPFGSIPGAPWAVLADPERNEFCAFPPQEEEQAASA
jgi:Glyoxalase-like domain